MKKYILENSQFKLELLEGKVLSVSLRDKTNNKVWRPSSFALIELFNIMEERIELIEDYHVMHIENIESQLHIIIRDIFHGITVGIWLILRDNGEFSVIIPPAEVEESNDSLYRIYALNVLPSLMSVSGLDKILLPINTGVLTTAFGKEKLHDRFLIYGEQKRWELLPTLPVCAVHTSNGGLVALATSGAYDMYCDVRTDGGNNGFLGFYPMFRENWVDPVDWTEREIRFSVLMPNDDIVVKSAKTLRKHIIDDLGKKTLKQRAEESPECAYQQKAYTMKMFHGIQQQGIMMFGSESKWDDVLFQRNLTFKDARKCFNRLKGAGIDRIYLQSVGWNPKGHDGAYPTDFPIDRRLGGEKEFVKMINEAKKLGFHITTHSNLNGAYLKSPDFHKDWVITNMLGEAKITGFWGGGLKANHWGLALPEGFLRSRLNALKRLGFNGMQYLDGIGNPLQINYHLINGGGRSKHAAGINRMLDLSKDIFGAVQTEMGFLYCVLHADAMCSGGGKWHLDLLKKDWDITGILGERVPVWQLALHGLITLENLGLDWNGVMETILFGDVPRDEWSMEGNVMPILTDERISKMKSKYDLCCDKYGYLIIQELIDWKKLDDNIEMTKFEDGTEVIADFGKNRLSVNGKQVECPNIYI